LGSIPNTAQKNINHPSNVGKKGKKKHAKEKEKVRLKNSYRRKLGPRKKPRELSSVANWGGRREGELWGGEQRISFHKKFYGT